MKFSYENYSFFEQILTGSITMFTNISWIPTLLLLYRRRMNYHLFLGILTTVSAIFYHFLESFSIKYFILSKDNWHKLDNIGGISCSVSLIIYLMNNENQEVDAYLNYFNMILILILQEKSYTNIKYTIFPLALFFCIYLGKFLFIIRKLPIYNWKIFKKSVYLLAICIFCFSRGLNRKQDYLRIFHGLWHLFLGINSFYFFQSRIDDKELNYFQKNNFY